MPFSLEAVFGVDTTGARAELKKFGNEITGLGGNVSALGKVLGTVAPLLGLGALVGFTKNIVDSASHIQDMSENLGVSTDALQAFNYQGSLGGVTTEQLNKMWEKSRVALDGLMSGSKEAEAKFAALHLTQADLIDLPLPQAVEKISKAYANAKDEAGAYDAIVSILGEKSAPKLMAMLDQLASDGLPKFIAGAKEAGQVLDSEFIGAMDRFGDHATTAWGAVKTAAGTTVGFFLSAMEKFGALAGGIVYGGEAMTESLKQAGGAAQTLVTDTAAAAAEAKKLAEEQKASLEAEIKLRASVAEKKVSDYNATLTAENQIFAARDAASAKIAASAALVAALKQEVADKEALINAHLFTGKNLEEQKNYLAVRQVELAKAEAAEVAAIAAAESKRFDDREKATDAYAAVIFSQKSSEQQLSILQKEKNDLEAEMRALKKGTVLYMEDAVELSRLEEDVREKIAQIDAHRLVSLHPITAELQRQLDIMMKQDALNATTGATYTFNGKAYGPALSQDAINQMSPAVLSELIRRNTAAIAEINATKYAGSEGNSGAAASNFIFQAEAVAQRQTEINRAMAVLNQNSGLKGANYDVALKNFGGSLSQFDSLFQQANNQNNPQLTTLGNTAEKTQASLESIALGLRKNGFIS